MGKQLNKGEALHYLRKAVMFGNHGELPSKEDEALDQQFACLNLVTNAIIVYNTVHIARIANELRAEGLRSEMTISPMYGLRGLPTSTSSVSTTLIPPR